MKAVTSTTATAAAAALVLAVALLCGGGVAPVRAADPNCITHPCFNGGSCFNATAGGVTPWHCTCLHNYCGERCENVCAHTLGKALWTVRASGGNGGVELSGGLTHNPATGAPLWTGTSFSSSVAIGNLSLPRSNQPATGDAWTVAVDPAAVAAYVAADTNPPNQRCVCTGAADPATTPWGAITSGTGGGAQHSRGAGFVPSASMLVTGGTFSGASITYGATTRANAHTGTLDGWLAGTSATGQVQWVTVVGGPGNDAIHNVAVGGGVASSGTVVAVGSFTADGSFGGSHLTVHRSDVLEVASGTGPQPDDVFLVFVHPSTGLVTNAVSGGGGGIDNATAVAIDDRTSGTRVIVGGEWGSANFTWNGVLQPSSVGAGNTSTTTGFVMAVDAFTGNAVWWQSVTGCRGVSRVTAVAVPTNGTRIWVAGQYDCGGMTLAGQTAPPTVRGKTDVFLMALNEDGTSVWAVFGGGNGDDFPAALALHDSLWHVYVVGTFFSQRFVLPNGSGGPAVTPDVEITNYQPNPVQQPLTISENSQAFVVKLDDGLRGAVLWATGGGGAGNDYGTHVTVVPGAGRGGSSVAYVAGQFNSGTFTFGEQTLLPSTGLTGLGGGGDGFLVAVDEHDDCAPNPCRNGGVCIDRAGDFTCVCPAAFATNKVCGYDSCVSGPCQNGGTCQNGIDSYTCVCPTGTLGTNCQTNLDDCYSSPCQNGGTCVDGVNRYDCLCPAAFAPPTCLDPDHCLSDPCNAGRGHGTCQSFGASYTCSCVAGYGPESTCANDIDECASGPCVVGATCVDRLNGYRCACPPNRNGTICDIPIIAESSTGQGGAAPHATTASWLTTAGAVAAGLVAVLLSTARHA